MERKRKKKSTVIKLSFKDRFKSYVRLLWKQKSLILLILPAVILTIIFKYGPMYGILIAFKDYKPKLGIWNSPFGEQPFLQFIRFFQYVNFKSLIWNTIKTGVVTLIFTFPMPIIFALLLNEMKTRWLKRGVQTLSYVPHFISTVVIVGMLNNFGATGGLFNEIRTFIGLDAINMNSGDKYFLLMYVGSAVWQGMGWGSIIYLSALSNVDTSLYDVANIDGANRWQKIKNIALPTILPTSTVILIMNAGGILSQDFTKILLMINDTNRSLVDVIGTYVHRMGIGNGEFEYSTAVNLFISILSFILVYGTNKITQKLNPENSLW